MNDRRPTPRPEDDEPEMEIISSPSNGASAGVPEPPLLPRPPRGSTVKRRSGLAEEPIESGEIVQKRSLVIRSQPAMERLDMPPTRASSVELALEGPAAVVTLPPAPARRRGWLWLVGAVAAAGVGLALTVAAKPTITTLDTKDLEATAALIGTTIDGEARGVQVRVEAVATSSMLRAGIVTDAQTLADMARDKDVVFPVEDGESLEVFQIVDGKRASLLRVPADSAEIDPPPAGKSVLEARIGDVLAVTVTAKVAPQQNISGEVALSAPISLDAVRKRLADRVEEAVITGTTIPVVLVKSSGVKGNVITLPIAATAVDTKLSFSAIVRPQVASSSLATVRLGVFGLAGLFALLFLVSLIRRS